MILHSFHIPVMGTGFSIDTPIKVAHFGIDSVVSLVDDDLIEQMREYYSKKLNIKFHAIRDTDFDFRAFRITSYLNLVYDIINKKFHKLKRLSLEKDQELSSYFLFLPDTSPLKILYRKFLSTNSDTVHKQKIRENILSNMRLGEIQVNIMTKIDKTQYFKDKKDENGVPVPMPSEFSDALSALRGFAKSDLASGIVFSAGMNRYLYSYIAKFQDFYSDVFGNIKKRIILKISDYRSAMIQGGFLAKKGLWVSEFRIESGINCGGHAFISNGRLMGDILQEMKDKKEFLKDYLHSIFVKGLKKRNLLVPKCKLNFKITAQGGVGNASEHGFLLHHYGLDSVGWGSPFLLVPEVTAVSKSLLERLKNSKHGDIYLSDSSPLGVPFYHLKSTELEIERQRKIDKKTPGSSCPKHFLVSNTEFTDTPICVSSRQYQKLKLDLLGMKKYLKRGIKDILVKSCLCVGLSDTALDKYTIKKGNGMDQYKSTVCPGPNLIYFNKIVRLKDMIDHIYGRCDLLSDPKEDKVNTSDEPRRHVFINELVLYVDYLKKIMKQHLSTVDYEKIDINQFVSNLLKGIQYYSRMFSTIGYKWLTKDDFLSIMNKFEDLRTEVILQSKVQTTTMES